MLSGKHTSIKSDPFSNIPLFFASFFKSRLFFFHVCFKRTNALCCLWILHFQNQTKSKVRPTSCHAAVLMPEITGKNNNSSSLPFFVYLNIWIHAYSSQPLFSYHTYCMRGHIARHIEAAVTVMYMYSKSLAFHERMLPTRRGSNPQPPDHQLDGHPIEPLRPAHTLMK